MDPPAGCLDLMILDSRKAGMAIGLARREGDVIITNLRIGKKFEKLQKFRDRIRKALEPGPESRPSEKDLVEFGIDLFEFCFAGPLSGLYPKIQQDQPIRVQLITDRVDLKSIPWEYMQEKQQQGSGPRRWRSIVRIVPSVGFEHKRVKLKSKIRVLFAASYPIDQQSLDWSKVKRDVEESLRPYSTSVDFNPIVPADWSTFKNAVAKFHPHVIHFCGHGAVGPKGTQLQFMNAATKQSEPVGVTDITTFLSGLGIQLIVLSACDTSAQPKKLQKEFAVIAETLVGNGVPAVVANQLPVPNDTGAKFVGPLYSTLLDCGDIDIAVGAGRVELAECLYNESDRAKLEWGIPTLHRHLACARLFEI